MKQKTYTQLKEEIEKGCGKGFGHFFIYNCGDLVWDEVKEIKEFVYCPNCEAKLQTLKESRMIFIQEELEFLKGIRLRVNRATYINPEEIISDLDKEISQLQKELKELEYGEE